MQIDEAYALLNLVQDFVPTGNSNRPGTKLKPSSITIHNTDNTSLMANAAAHAKYMKGADAQKRQVSWHFTVDDKFVYQSLPTNEIGWHSGTKAGNSSSVAIEICMHPEMDVEVGYDRAALLTAVIAYRLGIQVPAGVFQHHDWSGKNCPRVLREENNGWSKFLKLVVDKWKLLEPVITADISAPDEDHHNG